MKTTRAIALTLAVLYGLLSLLLLAFAAFIGAQIPKHPEIASASLGNR